MFSFDKTISRLALTAGAATLVSSCAGGALNYADDEPVVPIVTTGMGEADPYAEPDPYDADPYDRYAAYNPCGGCDTPAYRAASLEGTDRYSRYAAPADADPADFYGLAGGRYAHQLYSDAYAERLDGQCQAVVRVGRGDTLSDVAEYCDTTVVALMSANNIYNPHRLNVGQRLRVPDVRGTVYAGTTFYDRAPRRIADLGPIPAVTERIVERDEDVYVVRRGDTLSEIASLAGVSTRSLARLNPHIDPWQLDPGDRLILPAGASLYDRPVLADRTVPAQPAPRTAPVVIYIGDDLERRAPSYAREGKAVVVIDKDERGYGGIYDRSYVSRVESEPHVTVERPLIPNGTVMHLRSSLPDARTGNYADMGTACMREQDGKPQIYRVDTAGGPDCGADRAVRLYRTSH